MSSLVSVIIVNWNGRKYLEKCISSLLLQTYQDIEIILVDNASTDDSVEFVRERFPPVRIIYNDENLGFAEGTNIGIRASKGEYIALVNQDAFVHREWLARLVGAMEKSPEIAAAAGKVYYWGNAYGKDAVFCTWSKIDPYTARPYNFHDNEPESEVDYVTGCAALLRKTILDEVGLLDTEYFLYFEETDWCARAIRAGYKLMYIPEATVEHVVSGSISNAEYKTFYMMRNRLRFALKNFDMIFIPILIAGYKGESMYSFFQDVRNRGLSETRIRLRASWWNLVNIIDTVRSRQRDRDRIKKQVSYNRSLPLRKHKVLRIEKLLG